MGESIVKIACGAKRARICENHTNIYFTTQLLQAVLPTNSSLFVYVRQFGNCAKKSFEGCDGTITNFPIPSASATVVQRTSLVDGFIKI